MSDPHVLIIHNCIVMFGEMCKFKLVFVTSWDDFGGTLNCLDGVCEFVGVCFV